MADSLRDLLGDYTEQTLTIRVMTIPKLPETVHGLCAPENPRNPDGKFLIWLNGNDSEYQQTETFIHEMLHIWHGDHGNDDMNVQLLETIRHKETSDLMQLISNS